VSYELAECGECGKWLPRNEMNTIGRDGETDIKTGWECDDCFSRGIEGDDWLEVLLDEQTR